MIIFTLYNECTALPYSRPIVLSIQRNVKDNTFFLISNIYNRYHLCCAYFEICIFYICIYILHSYLLNFVTFIKDESMATKLF